MWYGQLGSSALGVAIELSIGEGTVFLYCKWVSCALCQLKSQFLGWLDPACKEVISKAIEQAAGFQKCLGSGDGCLIQFTQQPLHFGHMYKCWKKVFGVCYILAIIIKFLTNFSRQIFKLWWTTHISLSHLIWVGQDLSQILKYSSTHIFGLIADYISRMENIF